MSLHIKEDYTKFSLNLDDQENKISFVTASYSELLENMITNNTVSTKIEIAKIKLEATFNMRLDELKSETASSIDMKISTLSSNTPLSSYEHPLADIIKFPLIKSPEKYSHASQFTKHRSSMTIEGDTLLQIQKW